MCTDISTFLFFDTETTGLPSQENNQTKITELSMLAVNKGDLTEAPFGTIPNVYKKISILFNPERAISEGARNLNGLTNDILKDEPKFQEKFETIKSFLDALAKPVCMIAHNGYKFDYGILLAECNDANLRLPEHLLCYDSLEAFRAILKDNRISFETLSGNEESPEKENQSSTKTEDFDWNSFHLVNLYKRLLNKPPTNSHRAEGDCIMMLECVAALKDAFVPLAESGCKPLNEMPPLVRP